MWNKVSPSSFKMAVVALILRTGSLTSLAEAQHITMQDYENEFEVGTSNFLDVIVKFKDATGHGSNSNSAEEVQGFPNYSRVKTYRQVDHEIPASAQSLLKKYTNHTVTTRLERSNAVALTVSKELLNELLMDPNVDFIERDHLDYPQYEDYYLDSTNGEVKSWGIKATQAHSAKIPNAVISTPCFKICVVDSGLFVDHPDIVSFSSPRNLPLAPFFFPKASLM